MSGVKLTFVGKCAGWNVFIENHKPIFNLNAGEKCPISLIF